MDLNIEREKILYLITDLDIGGAEKIVLSLCKDCANQNYKLLVGYLRGEAPLSKEFQRCGINVVKIRSFWSLVFLIKKHKIKLIHTHLIWGDIYGIIAARLCGCKVVTTKHNTNYFQGKREFFYFIDSFINKMANKIVCVSNAVKKFYIKKEKINKGRIDVIYNGIDLEYFKTDVKNDFRESYRISQDKKIITTIANFTKQKGYSCLLKAAEKVSDEYSDVMFVWVGNGALFEQIKDEIIQAGLKEKVLLTGVVDDVRPILSGSDLFVLPSLWEGFGLVFLEAMAFGLPIVASAADGICEILKNEPKAILVEPGNVPQLAEAIILQLSDNKYSGMQYKGLDKFNTHNMCMQYLSLYGEMMQKG